MSFWKGGVARRLLLIAAAVAAAALVAACGSSSSASSGGGSSSAADNTITVGVPRSFGYLSTLWARNVQPPGVTVKYVYFPDFTQMLTALNSGKIDLTEIGDVGAVQSYVNGGHVRTVAVTQPNALNCGLLVPRNSTVRTFADLRGRRIAFLKSTNSYIAFLHLARAAGLKESDFQIIQITGAPANKAFQTGQLDAYFSIDPNMADLVEQTGGRILTTCQQANVQNLYPYVATDDAIKNKSRALGAVIQALADDFTWIQQNPDEQARLLAPRLGFSESSIRTTYARGARGLQPIDSAFYTAEQPVIDELVAARIVTRPVRAQDVFSSQFNADVRPGASAGQ